MYLRDKKVLVIGLAVSGIPTVQILNTLEAVIMVNDMKTEEQLKDELELLKDIKLEMVLGHHPIYLADWPELVVVSPGVPMDIPLINEIQKRGIETISEIELAFRLTKAPIVAITGTNGKTTTTTLVGEIFKKSGMNTHVVGTIGIPII